MGFELRMRRTISAPRAVVYRALTDPAELARWWGPKGFTVPAIDFEPRVGRGYRITMQPPQGERFFLVGEIREAAPERLSFTFRWEPPDPDDRETLVTLGLEQRGGGSEIRLTQGEFATEARRALHEQGWTESLDRLEGLLAG